MKIICIGRNYALHAKELGNNLPTEPIFFMKPDTALLKNNEPFYMPLFASGVDYETELVVKISKMGRAIEERFANRYYEEVGLGIDFTARDYQKEVMAKGLPWEKSKAFDGSAVLSPTFLKLSDLGGDTQKLKFEMWLNGEKRQDGDTSMMVFSVDQIISYVSQFVTLRVGDLIYTGTPAGVDSVKSGDNIKASLMGHELLNFDIK